jgi:RNA polymerase primary sigma factor
VEPSEHSENLARLLDTGRARGFVLYEEIERVLSPGREGVAQFDKILSELTTNSIEVRDEPRTEDSVPNESFFDREELKEDFGDSLPLRMYLTEVVRVPRLTVEDERELARRIHEALPAALASGDQGAKQAWEEAEKRLIEPNLWIALGTATHFMNRGLKLLDLVQEGNIGLMRAAMEYNHLRAYRFSTYATWWVRRAIIQALDDNDAKRKRRE